MSREELNRPGEPRGLTGENTHERLSTTGGQGEVATREQIVYRGRRDPVAPVGEEVEVTVDGEPLDKRYDLLSASPSGFEWAYGGSGPAQLAIALLAHATDEKLACRYYQQFKEEIVAELPEDGWRLTSDDIETWVSEVER